MRSSNRRVLIALTLAAMPLVAVGGAIFMRHEIVEGLVIGQLAARGIDAQLRIANINLTNIEIEAIAVGALRIEHVELGYSIREAIRGQIRVVKLDGLEMTIDLTGEGPPLGELQTLLPDGDTALEPPPVPSAAPLLLPAVTITGARVAFLLPEREVHLDATADLQPIVGGNSQLALIFDGQSGSLRANGDLHMTLAGTTIGALASNIELTDEDNAITFSLDATTDSLAANQPELRFNLRGDGLLSALAVHAALDETLRPEAGAFEMDAEGTLLLPSSSEDPFKSLEGEMAFAMSLSSVTLPNPGGLPEWALNNFNAEITSTVALHDTLSIGAVTAELSYSERDTLLLLSIPETRLVLNDDFSLNAVDLNMFSASGSAIPTPYGMLRTVQLDGSLTNLPSAPTGTLRLQASSPALSFASVSANTATIDANAVLAPMGDGVRLELNTPAQFSFGILNLPGILPIEDMMGQVPAARFDLRAQDGGFSFTQTARLSIPPLQLSAERQGAPPIVFQVTADTAAITVTAEPGQSAHFNGATVIPSFSIPDAELIARGLDLNFSGVVGGEVHATLTGGTFSQTGAAPFFPALIPELQLVQNGNEISFGGNLREANNLFAVLLNGGHDLATGQGNMSFVVDELVFEPGRTGSAALFPPLARMQDLQGRVSGGADFNWTEGGLESSGRLDVANLSFRQNGITIEGFATQIVLDRLMPPRSLPDQHLTIRRIDTGIEVSELEFRFMLDSTADGTPRIQTEALTLNVAGGRITAEGGTIDPMRGDATISLRAENLDLELLLARIGLDELTGQGRLSGVIPLRINEGGASIEGASLQDGGAGVVAYRSERAREALASGGDSVELVLDALEDFHYDTLSMILNKPIKGDTQITLRLRGRNPALLEGHPVDLNLTLTGDTNPLLEALAVGQRLSNDFLRSLTGQ